MKLFLLSIIAVLLLVVAFQTGKGYAAPYKTKQAEPKYIILLGKSADQLQLKVSQALKEGYTPAGGVAIYNNNFLQAAYK